METSYIVVEWQQRWGDMPVHTVLSRTWVDCLSQGPVGFRQVGEEHSTALAADRVAHYLNSI